MKQVQTSTPLLKLQLDASGEVLDTLEDWSLDEGYWESADTFRCTLITDRFKPSELFLQPVTLILGDVPWMKARIEVVESDDNQVTINLSGRDYISELVEGHVSPDFKITEKTSLADAILQAAKPYGITKILGDGDMPLRKIRCGYTAGTKSSVDFKAVKLDELQPKDGQSVYEFCNRLAARSGCTIQPHISRDTLVLAVPNYQAPPAYELRRSRDRIASPGNNVMSARCTRDGTHWPTVLRITGGMRPVQGGFAPSKAPEEDTSSPVRPGAVTFPGVDRNWVEAKRETSMQRLKADFSTEELAAARVPKLGAELAGKSFGKVRTATSPALPPGQLYRLYHQDDNELRTPEQVMSLGARVLGERLKATLVYSCKVRGFADPATGRRWTVDTIVNVRDEIADVDEPLWIQTVTRSWSRTGGAVTELSMIRPGVVLVGADL